MRKALKTALLAAGALAGASAAAGPLPLSAAHAATVMEASAGTETIEDLNAVYTTLLERYIVEKDGIHLFDYNAVSDVDRAALADYVIGLQKLHPSQMSVSGQIAYWANLYNAKTLEIILDNYPVASIRDIKSGLFSAGPWGMEVVTVEGKELSLDNIEHDIVRATFKEPRVHYAFNCASIGCPNLAKKAWSADTLDEDLDAAARAYIASPRGVRVEDGKVIASSIYKWFKKDFGKNDAEVLDHIRQYASGEKLASLKGKTKISRHEYDWSLNDAK